MFADHDAYLAQAPEDFRPLLVRLRAQLARALPDAEEVIAYKMPGFRIGKCIPQGVRMMRKYFRAAPDVSLPRDIAVPPATEGFPAGSQEVRSSLLCN